MRAFKWAAGVALGIDPEESAGFGSRRRSRTGYSRRDEDSRSDSRTSRSGRAKDATRAAPRPRAYVRGGSSGGGWMDDEDSSSCLLCDAVFTFTNRRHHCRACLKLVCSACSSNLWKLESGRSRGQGNTGRRAALKRVCDKCYAALVATKEVLVGGDAATRDSNEYAHFEVIVHETVGRGQNPTGNVPPSVPVGPSSPRPGFESGGGACEITIPSAEAAPRLPGSEVLNRARAPYCRLSVAGKQVGKTRPVPQPQSHPLSPRNLSVIVSDAAATGGGGGTSFASEASSFAGGQGRRCFEQNFLFRVSCACRTADYVVLEVRDRVRGLSGAAGADPLLGHCRVPLYRIHRRSEQTSWHMLLEADGAPGAVGRALVTVRNLGGGSIPRPAWGSSLPGGSIVPPPNGFMTRGGSAAGIGDGGNQAREEASERERTTSDGFLDKDGREGGGGPERERDRGCLPDNPLLEAFYPRESRIHELLFFRVENCCYDRGGGCLGGRKGERVVPFDDRVLQVFTHVRMWPLVDGSADQSGGTGGPPSSGSPYARGGGSGSGFYPRAVAAAAASLDPWGVRGGLRGAFSSARTPSHSAGAVTSAAVVKTLAVGGGTSASGKVSGFCAGDEPSSTFETAGAAGEATESSGSVADGAPGYGVGGGGAGGGGGGAAVGDVARSRAPGPAPGPARGDDRGGCSDHGDRHSSHRDWVEDGGEGGGADMDGLGRARSVAAATSSSVVLDGALVLTTHRVIFVERRHRCRRHGSAAGMGEKKTEARWGQIDSHGGDDAGTLVEIPLAYIVETKVKRKPSEGLVGIQIECRDNKTYYFAVARGPTQAADAIQLQGVRRFEDEIAWLCEEDNFANSSDTCRVDASLDPEGETLGLDPDANPYLDACDPTCGSSDCTRGFPSSYHPALEYRRQGIDDSKEWAYIGVNKSFRLCPTYGRYLAVPSALSEEDIRKASKWRSRCRIPVLTWLHPLTGAGLCRSSQPMTGLGINPSSPEDEQLLTAIRAAADLFVTGAAANSDARVSAVSVSDHRGGGCGSAPPSPARGRAAGHWNEEAVHVNSEAALPVGVDDDHHQIQPQMSTLAGGLSKETAASTGSCSREGYSELPGVSPSEPLVLTGGEEGLATRTGEKEGRGTSFNIPTVLFPRDLSVGSGDDGDNDNGGSGSGGGSGGGSRKNRVCAKVPLPSTELDGPVGREKTASLSLSSNVAAELRDAIVSPVTSMAGSGITISGGGGTGVCEGGGCGALVGGGGFVHGVGSHLSSTSRSPGVGERCESGVERDVAATLEAAATAAATTAAAAAPASPAVGGLAEQSRCQHQLGEWGKQSSMVGTSLATCADGESVLDVAARGEGASSSCTDGGRGVSAQDTSRTGESGIGESTVTLSPGGIRACSDGVDDVPTLELRLGDDEAAIHGGFFRGGSTKTSVTLSSPKTREQHEMDGGASPPCSGVSAGGGIDEQRIAEQITCKVVDWDKGFGLGDADQEDGPHDDDEDARSVSSSSVTSVASAPGNPSPISSRLVGSGMFRSPSSCEAAADCPPRACSDPGSPQAKDPAGSGGVTDAVVTPNSVERQRALSVPTSLASIASPAASTTTPVGKGTNLAVAAAEGILEKRTPVLRIIDARPMISAKGHLLMGKGHEVISRLGGPRCASLTFLEIPNVNAMQQSFSALMTACSVREDDPAWLVNLHNSRWLEHVGALLKGASDVAAYLEAGDPVLVHCSDGWDRTSQLTALAQLILDPYYRTIDGFQVLVSKDWCSFGHRFAARGGHGREGTGEMSPIFPQFLDATHQLLRQFPTSFEFSESLLVLLLNAHHSRWFNDFLHDSEYERALAHARPRICIGRRGGSTVSVWSHVYSCREFYSNVLWAGKPGPCRHQPGRLSSSCSEGAGGVRGGEQGGCIHVGAGTSVINGGGVGGGDGGVVLEGSGRGCERQADADARRTPSRREPARLPPPLWPACGIRSLFVWRRAWESRGIPHPAYGNLGGDNSLVEETLSSMIRQQREVIDALCLRPAAARTGGS